MIMMDNADYLKNNYSENSASLIVPYCHASSYAQIRSDAYDEVHFDT
jgi:hypothetical protein